MRVTKKGINIGKFAMTSNALPRRQFLRGGFLSSLQSQQVKQQGFAIIRPPWAIDEVDFINACNRCGDCIRQCETQILISGAGGFPEVSFAAGECTFCQKCVEVCNQPVFRPLSEAAWTHKVSILDHCLTKHRVACRSCGDSCEMRAIRFVPTLGGIAQIVLNLDSCNGCGACIQSCPVVAINVSYPEQIS